MNLAGETLDLWDSTSRAAGDEAGAGLYVAISGNTAAGKSTLIAEVVTRARALGLAAIGISERSFHHPYLTRMFADPARYAFGIQVNFMLQRHLVLLRQLELGRLVIIERSHFDDELFVREHADAGNVSGEQLAAYEALARVLHDKLPAPHVLALLNPSPELSLERLKRAELRGERPAEFPNDEAKEAWVRRWHALYETLHASYADRRARDPRFRHTRLLHLDTGEPVAMNASLLLDDVLAVCRQ
jgi:deoxyadenosine/deoxycytidine kinase